MASEGKYFKDNIATLGSVGIGKLTPTEKLDVVGNITLTGDLTIGGTPTAPTASAATNTTQLATTAYVTTAVNNLIDSAPAALDTLNELAAALNDDASFSTTVTNSIATKLPLAGGTMTGAILHSAGSASSPSISWDGDTDTGIYHYGANSFAFTTSGALRGQFQSGGKLKLWGGLELDGNTALIKTTLTVGVDDTGHDVKFFGATSGKYLLWDESEDYLFFPDNTKAVFGTGSDLEIYHSSSVSYIRDLGTGGLHIQTNGPAIYLQDTDGNTMAQFTDGGACHLQHDNSLKFSTTATGVAITGGITTTGASTLSSTLTVGVDDTGHDVKFFGATSGSYMLWDESQDDLILGGAARLGIGTTAPAHLLDIHTASNDTGIRVYTTPNTRTAFELLVDSATNGNADWKLYHGTVVNTRITSNAGNATYFNAGDVGFGTTSPSAKVHLNGPSAGFSEILRLQRDGGNYYSIGLDNNDLNFCYNGQSADGSALVIDGATSRIGIGTKAPSSLLEVRGAAGAAGILTLSTAETTVVDGDELGRINFSAPLESDGTDSILVAASIYAEADDTFDASTNDTDLVFATGLSETATEKFRIDSSGDLHMLSGQKLHTYAGGANWINYNNIQMSSGSALTVNNAGSGGLAFQTGGTTRLAIDQNGVVTVGVDDTGYDVKFFGATAGSYMLWDESTDDLILGGASRLGIGTTTPTANLDITTSLNQQHLYIQGALDSGNTALVRLKTIANGNVLLLESGSTSDSREIFEVKNSNGTVFKIQGDGASVFSGAVTVGVDDTGYDVKFFGATSGRYMLWDESTNSLNLTDTTGLYLGDSQDLQLYHSTHSYIENKTGDLYIKNLADDKDIIFECDDGSGGLETYFYLDGSASSGDPYTIFPDSSRLAFGDGKDLRIMHDGSNSSIYNYVGNLVFKNYTDDGDIEFHCDNGSGGTETYFYLDGSLSSGSPYTIFPDNAILGIGTGADLQFYHNGTNTSIINTNGDLYIQNSANDKDIVFQSDDGEGGMATYFKLDGSYTAGIDGETYTPSTVFPDHALLALGTHRDLRLWYNNSRGRIAYTGGNEFQISAINNLMIGFNDSDGVWGETSIYCFKDGKVQIRHDNSTKFETTSTGIAITGGITTTGASTLSGGLTVGVDDTGYDVKFFGATSGSYMEWDASDDALEFTNSTLSITGGNTGQLTINAGDAAHSATVTLDTTGSNGEWRMGALGSDESFFITNVDQGGTSAFSIHPTTKNVTLAADLICVDLDISGDVDIDGTTNLDAVDIDGNVQLDGTLTVGVDDTGYDVKFFGATSGMYLLWDESANALTGVYDLKIADSREIQLGGGNDLRLYHSHPNSYIKCNQGDLVIQNDADDIKILAEDDVVIRDNDDSTEMAKFINGGAVELYHNGSKKFETTSSGATVTGGLTTTAVSTIGGSLDIEGELNLTGNGNKNFDVFTLANSNTLTIRHHNPSGNLFETAAVFTANAGAELYYDHSKKFETTSAGATVTGNLTVSADLIINGTTTTVNSTTVTIDDPVFTLGGDSAPSTDDNKDRGIEFRYHNGSAAKIGFFGWDDSASVFTFIADASPLSEVYSGSAGNVAFGNIAGTLTTAAQGNITSLGTLTTLTVDDITIDGSTISDAGDLTVDVEGDISFDANGGDFKFQDNGVDIIHLTNVGDSPTFESKISNADIVFKGNDGGSTITALTLDMSAGGNASFSGNTSITGGGTTSPSGVNGLHLMFDSSSATSWIKSEQNGTSNRHLGFHAASYTFNTGASTFNAAITVGVDDTGHDVKFFGATAGSYLMWDESQDRLRLTDSTPMTFGDGDDLRIEHDGSNSYITEQGQNDLYIQPNEASLYVRNAHSGKMMLTAKSGSGHIVELYGNNVKRLATDSSGVNITGELNVGVDDTGHDVKFFGDTAGSFMLWDASQDRLELTDDSRIVFGDGADASIWHGGTDTYIENGTGDLVIRNQADDKDIIFSADAGGTLAEIMRIDGSTGRVGIGVTAPSSPLHTKGAIRIERTANTASSYIDMEGNFRYYADTGYAHAFFSQGSEMVRFYNGQVGIGTTSPEAPLHVLGGYDANDPKTLVLAGREESSSTVYTGIQFERSGGGTFFGLGNDSRSDRDELYVGGGFGSVKTATALRVYTGTRGSSTGTERLTVLSDGNVGIGYASPSHKLHVRAEADGDWVSRITNTEATAGANYGLKIDGGSNASDVALEVSSLAGTHLFEVRGDGNVGIGTTSPSAKVHLNGPSAGFSEILRLQRDGGNYYSIGLDNNDLNFCYNGQSADGSTLVIDGATSRIGIGTKAPSSLLEVRGAAGAAGILTLSTAETTVVDGDELGRINFSAPLESDGTDSILVAASIYAEADDTFDASTNDTDLVFATGASETATEKMRIASDGNVGIGTTSPAQKLHVEGTARITGHTDIANSIDISNTTRIYTKLGVGNSSWVTPTEALEVRGNARIGSSATNGHLIGRKDYSVTESFSTGLTVTLADNTACHVKVFISGDWSGHSSIAYVGEFFIQNAANSGSYNEPGIILTEHDNLASDGILSQIVDGTGDSFTIQFRANTSSSTSVSGRLCYHIMGDATAVS